MEFKQILEIFEQDQINELINMAEKGIKRGEEALNLLKAINDGNLKKATEFRLQQDKEFLEFLKSMSNKNTN